MSSSSISGLSATDRAHSRKLLLAGVKLLLAHPDRVHYTQGPHRWDGINQKLRIVDGRFPAYGDCSSTTTWLLWNALYEAYDLDDLVNGQHWRAGYTGTMATRGKRVRHDQNIKVGDLVLYGRGPTYEHVAMSVGGRRVFSHGGEAGPFLLDLDYRPDRATTRRYI